MVLRRGFYFSFAAASAATMILAFNNCSREQGAVAGSSQLASTGCKINDSDVLLSSIKDGDDHVYVYGAKEEAARLANEKIYFNNTGNAATAPRWKVANNVVDWYYNPAGAPAALASTAVDVVKASMNYWSSVCNIKFNYVGTTTKSSDQNTSDNTNVVGWGSAAGATGVTFSYMKGSTPPITIAESDIQFNAAQIFDATTLRGVMNHELGHLIGMRHSDVVESILFANPYHDVPYLLTLRKDDIDACVGLYGAPGATATPTPTPAPTATPVTPTPTATPRVSPTPTPAPGTTPRTTPSTQGC